MAEPACCAFIGIPLTYPKGYTVTYNQEWLQNGKYNTFKQIMTVKLRWSGNIAKFKLYF